MIETTQQPPQPSPQPVFIIPLHREVIETVMAELTRHRMAGFIIPLNREVIKTSTNSTPLENRFIIPLHREVIETIIEGTGLTFDIVYNTSTP